MDWWPWSDEAFARARERDVPVMLSVGYASCHWCHVMAHESFTDASTARQLNENFVCIKVDREERPDVDAVYMSATQALTGSGGWPMTCFLTADAVPFYAGTYFPPAPTSGLPAFRQVLTAISEAWVENRGEVLAAAGRIGESLASMSAPLTGRVIEAADLDRAAAEMLQHLDTRYGGFGAAPKFPPTMALEFLLRHHERTGSEPALEAVSLTLDRMARGGIFDQLGGGFARYSVDRTWHVPHFEKMLDDNAQLLRLYAHHARLTGSVVSGRVAEQVAEFLLRDLRVETGAFAAALDADTGGVEGATYRWSRRQLLEVLGERDGAAAAELFALPAADDAVSAAGGSPVPETDGSARPPDHGTMTTWPRRCSDFPPTRMTRAGSPPCVTACWPLGIADRNPAATTSSCCVRTGWRSPRWPRPAPPPVDRNGSRPPRQRPTTCLRCIGSPAIGFAVHGAAGSAPVERCWPTWAIWRAGCWRCIRPPARSGGCTRAPG